MFHGAIINAIGHINLIVNMCKQVSPRMTK